MILYFSKIQPLILANFTECWYGPFIIDNYGGDHGTSYVVKTLGGEPVPNTYHGDYQCIFRLQEGYLRLADEEPLQVMYNLRFTKNKD